MTKNGRMSANLPRMWEDRTLYFPGGQVYRNVLCIESVILGKQIIEKDFTKYLCILTGRKII